MTPTTECLLHITLSVGLLGIQSDGQHDIFFLRQNALLLRNVKYPT